MKLNLKEKIGYFKKLLWLFLIVIILFNIVLFYLVSGALYFILLVVLNIVLVWILVPIFVWIWRTFLVDSFDDIVSNKNNEIKEKYEDDIIIVVEKK